MARYGYNSYRRRSIQNKRRTYIIAACVVVLLIVVIFGSWGEDEEKPKAIAEPADIGLVQPEPQPIPEPEPEPEPEPVLSEVAPEPVAKPNPQATEIIENAASLMDEKPPKVIEARDLLNEVLPMEMSSRQQEFVKKQLSELAEVWLFSRRVFLEDKLCGLYEVQPGDQLRTIGKKFKVPYEGLMQVNEITKAQSLQADSSIKVINGPFHARIYRSTFTMDLYLQNTFVRSFPIGLGRPGDETPTGVWRAKPGGKLISPTWTDPDTGKRYEAEDPDYPLGSRWIGLEGVKGEAVGREGFAIHGTKDPSQIGSATSRGCIRLHNGNVILVYNLLEPGYSRVDIVD
ncbi:MAG: L,D-transpeptidase family protein [Planctomycetota bacterium]|jgi:hypothetical protein